MNYNINDDVQDAIINGIDQEAVKTVMENFVEKEGETPKQFKDTVEIVAEMKNDKPDFYNSQYSSNLVQNNSNRIKEAIKNGIEPQEVSSEITRHYNNINTVNGQKKINFIVRLISKMKRQERKKQIQSSKELGAVQKIYTMNNENK